jgi:hypothetical protein
MKPPLISNHIVSGCFRTFIRPANWPVIPFLLAVVVVLLPSPTAAVSYEELIAPIGEAVENYFGSSVSTAGDVNGDGYDDVIVGAADNDAGGEDAGRAYVFYGGPNADVTADLVFTGGAEYDFFGNSVSTAGDVNGDGYDDVIVGAFSDSSDSGAGRAYVFFGGPGADSTADIVFSGEVYLDKFGISVSAAGDVNGDGYDDVIVGAQMAGGDNEGRAYVFYCGPDADLSADLVFTGEAYNNYFGRSVSTAGDVNGDGYDDVIVGADHNDVGGVYAGRAYVFFGGPDADTTADLIFTGEAVQDNFGNSVSTAGDVNGDGYDDVIVGARLNDAGGFGAGRAYVFFGGPSADLTADILLTGEAHDDHFGNSVSTAGDVNGDGYDDVIVGTERYWGTELAGQAYVFFGGPGADSTADLIFTGEVNNNLFGICVSTAGDVDGDGYDDVIVGAVLNDAGGNDAGGVFVYSIYPYRILSPNGGNTWVAGRQATVRWRGHDVADLAYSPNGGASWSTLVNGIGGQSENSYTVTVPSTPTDYAKVRVSYSGQSVMHSTSDLSDGVFQIITPEIPPTAASLLQIAPTGDAELDEFGHSVSTAGDVNGDGYDDVIVGATGNDAGGMRAGRAYIFFGGPGADTTADLTLTGQALYDNFGWSVSTAGDVNGDGYGDVIVGAPWNDSGGPEAGRAYVFFGGPGADTTADLVFTGEAIGDNFGSSVSTSGDVNGDGYHDLIVGAYGNDVGGPEAGRAYVFFGGPGSDTTADLIFTGEAGGDSFGSSVSTAGDVNGDGYDDVIVGAYYAYAGIAYVFFGGPSADTTADLTFMGEALYDYFGWSVSTAGDVNGDGYGDVIVGAPWNDSGGPDAGAAFVFFGGPGADTTADLVFTGEASRDFFGSSVSTAGDVNGDGNGDVIVGAYYYDSRGFDAGRAYVFFGGPGADTTADFLFTGEAESDYLGDSVSTAGDVNGDGYDDVIVGAYGNDAGGLGAGRAYVFDFNRYHLTSPSGGDVWHVGATHSITWLGENLADIWLSTDGGAAWELLETNAGGNASNFLPLLVPNRPTHYALIKVTPNSVEIPGSDKSDTLFTIDASIGLLDFKAVTASETGSGAVISWNTDPGPDNLAGYRLEKTTSTAVSYATWHTLLALSRETSYHDTEASLGTRYRLSGVNGLGHEFVLGETSFGTMALLAAWPLPFRGGDLTISFATAGGIGGGQRDASVRVYDLAGRLMRTIVQGEFPAGYNLVKWDGRDDAGRRIPSGVYLLRSVSGTYTETKKMLVVR